MKPNKWLGSGSWNQCKLCALQTSEINVLTMNSLPQNICKNMPGIYPHAQNETLNTIKCWVNNPVLEIETSMTNVRTITVISQVFNISLALFFISSIPLGQLSSLFLLITVILLQFLSNPYVWIESLFHMFFPISWHMQNRKDNYVRSSSSVSKILSLSYHFHFYLNHNFRNLLWQQHTCVRLICFHRELILKCNMHQVYYLVWFVTLWMSLYMRQTY